MHWPKTIRITLFQLTGSGKFTISKVTMIRQTWQSGNLIVLKTLSSWQFVCPDFNKKFTFEELSWVEQSFRMRGFLWQSAFLREADSPWILWYHEIEKLPKRETVVRGVAVEKTGDLLSCCCCWEFASARTSWAFWLEDCPRWGEGSAAVGECSLMERRTALGFWSNAGQEYPRRWSRSLILWRWTLG